VVSKFEQPETQFERTVRIKMECKIYLEKEKDFLKNTFEILIKFTIQ